MMTGSLGGGGCRVQGTSRALLGGRSRAQGPACQTIFKWSRSVRPGVVVFGHSPLVCHGIVVDDNDVVVVVR